MSASSDDLTLLTLGPQLRGGANVAIGAAAIVTVFGVIRAIVEPSIVAADQNKLELKNAAGRTVFIQFAPDPDIIIREPLPSGTFRHIIAIEVKGGKDFSNYHNRLGEAEKSHQKARHRGYTECWMVVNVDNIDLKLGKRSLLSAVEPNRWHRWGFRRFPRARCKTNRYPDSLDCGGLLWRGDRHVPRHN